MERNGDFQSLFVIYPNFPRENGTGALQELPAGIQGIKDCYRTGEKAFTAEELTAKAEIAFKERPFLLLDHYKSNSGSHIIQRGDSLSKLCQKFYGDVKYWPTLREINIEKNPSTIPDGDEKRLQIGKPLHIPSLQEIEEAFKTVGLPPNPRVEQQQLKKRAGCWFDEGI